MINIARAFLIMLKSLPHMHLKLLQKEQFKKTAEETGELFGDQISNRITKVSRNLQQNNLEKVTYENDKEMPKERYISAVERQEIIYKLRLKQYNNGISKTNKSFKKFTTKWFRGHK